MYCPRCDSYIDHTALRATLPSTCEDGPQSLRCIMDRNPLLVEREKTHGAFENTAEIAQKLKSVLEFNRRSRDNRTNEALDMIASKLARIVSGNSKFKDHFDDIAGYAKLGAEACE